MICQMNIRYRVLSEFDGIYAHIPDGFRPIKSTGYVPAIIAYTSYSHGVCRFEPNGDVWAYSSGAKGTNIICQTAWIAS